jgi:hypothetical protein
MAIVLPPDLRLGKPKNETAAALGHSPPFKCLLGTI